MPCRMGRQFPHSFLEAETEVKRSFAHQEEAGNSKFLCNEFHIHVGKIKNGLKCTFKHRKQIKSDLKYSVATKDNVF